MRRGDRLALAVAAALGAALLAGAGALLAARPAAEAREEERRALIGEARRGHLTLALALAPADIAITAARGPGRPLVLIDPGHGGRDPGATGASGLLQEKQATLAIARELRALLARRGAVRVALTRADDRSLSLQQRSAIARQLGADLFVSLHADSAPNRLARGATVYSLAEVASDVDSARFARVHNGSADSYSSAPQASVRALLADLAIRDEMEASAELAERLVGRAGGRLVLRPQPHRFAAFAVLRGAATAAILVEAGYLSNADDEALLATRAGRAALVAALARAIEADLALRAPGRTALPSPPASL